LLLLLLLQIIYIIIIIVIIIIILKIGTIPQEIGALVKLNTIDLFGNSMIGPLPSQIGKLTNLLIVKIQLGKGETTSQSIEQEPEGK
jgi:hypothetical protein